MVGPINLSFSWIVIQISMRFMSQTAKVVRIIMNEISEVCPVGLRMTLGVFKPVTGVCIHKVYLLYEDAGYHSS